MSNITNDIENFYKDEFYNKFYNLFSFLGKPEKRKSIEPYTYSVYLSYDSPRVVLTAKINTIFKSIEIEITDSEIGYIRNGNFSIIKSKMDIGINKMINSFSISIIENIEQAIDIRFPYGNIERQLLPQHLKPVEISVNSIPGIYDIQNMLERNRCHNGNPTIFIMNYNQIKNPKLGLPIDSLSFNKETGKTNLSIAGIPIILNNNTNNIIAIDLNEEEYVWEECNPFKIYFDNNNQIKISVGFLFVLRKPYKSGKLTNLKQWSKNDFSK